MLTGVSACSNSCCPSLSVLIICRKYLNALSFINSSSRSRRCIIFPLQIFVAYPFSHTIQEVCVWIFAIHTDCKPLRILHYSTCLSRLFTWLTLCMHVMHVGEAAIRDWFSIHNRNGRHQTPQEAKIDLPSFSILKSLIPVTYVQLRVGEQERISGEKESRSWSNLGVGRHLPSTSRRELEDQIWDGVTWSDGLDVCSASPWTWTCCCWIDYAWILALLSFRNSRRCALVWSTAHACIHVW